MRQFSDERSRRLLSRVMRECEWVTLKASSIVYPGSVTMVARNRKPPGRCARSPRTLRWSGRGRWPPRTALRGRCWRTETQSRRGWPSRKVTSPKWPTRGQRAVRSSGRFRSAWTRTGACLRSRRRSRRTGSAPITRCRWLATKQSSCRGHCRRHAITRNFAGEVEDVVAKMPDGIRAAFAALVKQKAMPALSKQEIKQLRAEDADAAAS